MKVIQINAVNGIKSTGRTTSELANYLNEKGHFCYIAYSEGVDSAKSYKIGKKIGKYLHSFFSRVFGKQAYYSKWSTRKLLKYINKIQPDVIHLHNLHSNFINLEMLLKFIAEKDIATVITLHDCWFYTGKCTHYTVDNCFRWKKMCGDCPRLKKDNISWFFDKTEKMLGDKQRMFADVPRLGVIGVSDWITTEAKMSILNCSNHIKRIYNWVDFDVFKPYATSIKKVNQCSVDNKFIILGVASNWSRSKGLERFIELSKNISEEKLIILVGNISVNVKLPSNILNLKETNNINDLVKYYSSADVFINLSLEETFGKTTAESLACGTPAIVLNSTANPEIIGKNCGYVLKEYSPKRLNDTINIIAENTKKYYSKHCIEYAKKKFDKNSNIEKHIDFYDTLLR